MARVVSSVVSLSDKTCYMRSALVNFSECVVYILWPVMVNRFDCVLC